MGSTAVTLAVIISIYRVDGLRMNHQDAPAKKKGISSSDLLLNGSRMIGSINRQEEHFVNWTRIDEDGLLNKKASELASKWLGPAS